MHLFLHFYVWIWIYSIFLLMLISDCCINLLPVVWVIDYFLTIIVLSVIEPLVSELRCFNHSADLVNIVHTDPQSHPIHCQCLIKKLTVLCPTSWRRNKLGALSTKSICQKTFAPLANWASQTQLILISEVSMGKQKERGSSDGSNMNRGKSNSSCKMSSYSWRLSHHHHRTSDGCSTE